MYKKLIVSIMLFIALVVSVEAKQHRTKPNILLVLLDDVGFMDFGAYGSDTATPNIDKLGKAGAMFTRYYSSPLCGPSRASLMTGQSPHQVGAATLAEVLTDEMRALPAYNMTWADQQQTIASRLKSAGYQTFVAGKWGIGDIGANLPHRFGFDRSWVLDSTGSSNYRAKSYLPHYLEVEWYEDGKRISLPEDFYSSRNIVDKMIEYVDEADPSKPYFGYLAFQAIHIPLQVSPEFINKYNGVFDRGWNIMRQERLQKAIALGLVPETTTLSDGAHNDREWNSLSDREKAYWARVMQVNAGMLESADFHLGRLISHLEAKGQLDNTIVIVTSDNGPEYNTLGKTSKPAVKAFEKFWMAIEDWDVSYENLGQEGSLAAIGHEWASVSAAPFHLFKFNASEGGMRVPLVVSGPGVEANKGFVDSRAQVADITPTLLDFAGINYNPDEFYGRSLKPLLTGQSDNVYGENDAFVFEVSGTAALYRGNWKITKTPPPHGDGNWHLYDLAVDPGETTDVALKHPSLFQDMLDEYNAYATDVGVFELPPGESSRKQLVINAIKGTAGNYWYLFAGLAATLLLAVYLLFVFATRLIKRMGNS
ncbi:sulfatase-like hydrolase/transferase [Alteromonas genovensis]|uniref:Sulfatase-like hydrolase/transferase n=1 Tax=Alteromonas genovensis TaxID=471225 RepID=A0A6N9T9J0_9ALTE|nr:arylsulfatase [Alteromonas genovensis]NDW13953.1 sulfatase-like hydrolase/transferase [Alteromonas genovensis]